MGWVWFILVHLGLRFLMTTKLALKFPGEAAFFSRPLYFVWTSPIGGFWRNKWAGKIGSNPSRRLVMDEVEGLTRGMKDILLFADTSIFSRPDLTS